MGEEPSIDAPVAFYFDEHIDPHVAAYLLARNIDVLTTQQAGRAAQQSSDPDQLAFATSAGRVMVTGDVDYLNERIVPAVATGAHGGIVYVRRQVAIGDQARFLRYLATVETMDSLQGRIVFYEPVPPGLFPDE